MNWYCIHTKPKKEKLVEHYLLNELGLETYYPRLKRKKTIRRVRREVLEPLFPRYLFCRLDLAQSYRAGTYGRDHNPLGFTGWLAGAGVKGGTSYGATDEFGYRAQENVATAHDFHATILHLLGLDHKQLTFYHNGIERRLTNVHGHVIHEMLA